jgi:hypothetical protein
MIRKRTLPQRRTRLADLDFCDVFAFVSGWHPGTTDFERSRSRWQMWPEYFAEYELLRDQVLASSWCREGKPPFAETELPRWVAAGRPVDWDPDECEGMTE